jgi:hypothetical protein
MKFPAPYVRKALATALSGNVIYNSAEVPVYEGEAPALLPVFIIVGGYSHTREQRKHCRSYSAEQQIEIITIKDDPSSKITDAVTELLMNAIPDDLSTTDFQILIMGESVSPLREDSASGQKVFRRLVTYELSIEEL